MNGWVGRWLDGFTVIIGLISVQVGLELDLSTGTELGNFIASPSISGRLAGS